MDRFCTYTTNVVIVAIFKYQNVNILDNLSVLYVYACLK
jgi:hypothetical protein